MTVRPPVATKITALRAIADHLGERAPSGDGHDAWKQVFGEVSSLASAAEALHNLHVTRDLTITDGAHVKRVAIAAQKLDRDVTAAVNRIGEIARAGRDGIAARRNAKIHLVPDREYAAELRAAFRALGPSDKTAMLNDFVERGDGPALASLIKVPTYLTGLLDEQRQNYELAYVEKHAPSEAAEEAALNEAVEAAWVATRTAGEAAKLYVDPIQLAAITKSEEAAAKAEAAFNRSVAGA